MFRLLDAEFYKLRKSKSFYISILTITGFILLMYSILFAIQNVNVTHSQPDSPGITVSAGKTPAGTESVSPEKITIMEILGQVFSGNLVSSVLAIYVSVFIIYEYSSGMIRNIAGKGHPRPLIFLSRLTAAVVSSLVITCAGIVAAIAFGILFIGTDALNGIFWPDLWTFTGLQLLLTAALGAIYALVSEICRNIAAGIAFSIGTAIIPTLILTGADLLCKDSGFTPSLFWPVSRSYTCPLTGFTTGYMINTALVAGFWLILTAVAGCWHFSHKDI